MYSSIVPLQNSPSGDSTGEAPALLVDDGLVTGLHGRHFSGGYIQSWHHFGGTAFTIAGYRRLRSSMIQLAWAAIGTMD
jgi:hypothetical protein